MSPVLPVALALFSCACGQAKEETVEFLGRTYKLGSISQKSNAMWEFVTGGETVDNWTTLLTVVDRPDAKTKPDLDRLAQGILDTYKARGGQVVMAKTMADASGTPFNYMVVGFEQPGEHRFELNFVKAMMGPKNAYMMIYGVRVADPMDHVAAAKAFMKQHSGEIGMALEKAAAPSVATWPRKEF